MTADSRHTAALAEPIAVVGLGCLFPGASDVGMFWRNIVSKTDAITDPPHEAWDPALFYDASSNENDRVYCRKGGYLGPLAHFNPLEHGIMPRAVEGGEPDQWLALRVASEALRDAGCADAGAYRERAALILGKGTYANRGTLSVVQHALVVDYTLGLLKSIHPELTADDLRRIRADLKQRLPRFDAETAPGLIPNVTVGRIANRLDIMGPSYTVDAACASSLVAIDIAVKGLRQGEYDLALVGGLQAATPLPVLGLFCQLKALSLGERIRPFDKDADGTLLSEGIGMAVLKRRSQAERDGDRIYAFITGTGVASDGRAVGVLAPRVEGEELALRRAYASAGVAPSTIGLIEAHGTGTLVGDAVEVEALTRVFGERVRAPHCALGSVKSMIGHTMPAAGMAGFIKAVLALHHKVVPPTINVTQPSPRLRLDRSPFYINTETRPWIHGDPAHPRRAGINAFGFGGINAHVVVEEGPASDEAVTVDTEWDSEVCLFSGASRNEVIALGRQVAATLSREPAPSLADVAFSLNAPLAGSRTAGPTLGIVARSTDDLARKLERALTRLADPACHRIKEAGGIYYFDEPLTRDGTLAFVFPGEGAQYVNMLGDLCRHFPVVRRSFDAMDRVLFDHPRGYRLSEHVFPPPAFSESEREAAERRLVQMDIAVEAVVTANHAIHALLKQLGIVPDAILGHSSGEYSAMRAAGMVDEEHNDARIVELNDRHGRAAEAGALPMDARLIAIGASRERVESLCESMGATASVAMDNCRHQVVVIAAGGSADRLEARLRDEGLLYDRLPFDRPYHTPDFEPFAGTSRPLLEQWIVRPPVVPLYSCTSTTVYPSDTAEARRLAFEHWIRPVEFRRTIENMWRDGVRIFVEAGPRGNLSAFIEDILGDRPFAAIPANVSRRSGLTQLHHLVAQLAAHRVPMTLAPLYERRGLSAIEWSQTASRPDRHRSLGLVKLPTGAQDMRLSPETIELIRSRAGSSSRPAMVAVPTTPAPVPPLEAPSSGAPRVMSAFMSTMGRFLEVERELVDANLSNTTRPGRRRVSGPSRAPMQRLPLIEVTGGAPGTSVVARCTLDLNNQPFLRDHTLGRNVSTTDAMLTGFPIVPFTSLMEIMAEAAAALGPHMVVAGMRDVRVNRWLAVDRGPLQLEIAAELRDGSHVSVRVLESGASEPGPVAEGVVVLAAAYPPPPESTRLHLLNERGCKWTPEQLYEDVMFHGPLFRGVQSVDRVGDNGAEATLTVIPLDTLLAPGADRAVTDFALLDQPGQVVGFWTSQYLEHGFVVLPFYMRELQLYGPPLPAGEQLTCHAQIALVGDHQVRSDLDVVRADGRLWARFEGWEDRRFELPREAFSALLHPATERLSQPWPLVDHSGGTRRASAFRIGLDTFPAGWLHAHGGLWSRVLGALVLSRREREIWNRLKAPERRRLEWLLGRIAAKDAVREYLQREFDMQVLPADVEVLPDASDRPVVAGAWTRQLKQVPLVSIAHVEGAAVALVSGSDGVAGVGVDLERHGRMKPGMERVAFSECERDMLGTLEGDERQAWALRLWCAKEASAKATGGGVSPVSPTLAIEQIHREHGTVVLNYSAPGTGPVSLSATTAREGDWIVATCIR